MYTNRKKEKDTEFFLPVSPFSYIEVVNLTLYVAGESFGEISRQSKSQKILSWKLLTTATIGRRVLNLLIEKVHLACVNRVQNGRHILYQRNLADNCWR